MTNDLIAQLNARIAEINTANINLHRESGDIQDWLEDWREDMAGISISLFTILSVMRDDGR